LVRNSCLRQSGKKGTKKKGKLSRVLDVFPCGKRKSVQTEREKEKRGGERQWFLLGLCREEGRTAGTSWDDLALGTSAPTNQAGEVGIAGRIMQNEPRRWPLDPSLKKYCGVGGTGARTVFSQGGKKADEKGNALKHPDQRSRQEAASLFSTGRSMSASTTAGMGGQALRRREGEEAIKEKQRGSTKRIHEKVSFYPTRDVANRGKEGKGIPA